MLQYRKSLGWRTCKCSGSIRRRVSSAEAPQKLNFRCQHIPLARVQVPSAFVEALSVHQLRKYTAESLAEVWSNCVASDVPLSPYKVLPQTTEENARWTECFGTFREVAVASDTLAEAAEVAKLVQT